MGAPNTVPVGGHLKDMYPGWIVAQRFLRKLRQRSCLAGTAKLREWAIGLGAVHLIQPKVSSRFAERGRNSGCARCSARRTFD